MMDGIYSQCCGLDVHKKTVTACRITSTAGAEPLQELRTFSTMTADLVALADWLQEAGCTHVAMESTGVYTLPGILPMVGGMVRRRWQRSRTNAKDDPDVLLIHFDPLD